MNLSDVFDETDELPASRLDVEEIYRAGLRRRRISAAGRVGLVVLPVMALVVALVGVFAPFRNDDVADGWLSRWVVHAVGGFDQQRLWAYVEPCAGCGFEMHVTTDGGRTWTQHLDDDEKQDQLTLPTASGGLALMRYPSATYVGTNGWDGLRIVEYSADPVVATPLDAPVHCFSGRLWPGRLTEEPDPGTVRVVDIPGERYGPTPAQPPFPCRAAVRAPDGVIMAAGRDPGTGRAAVARSLDNGSTWEPTLLDADLPAPDPQVADLLTSSNGGAVVAFRQGPGAGLLYRYDAGSWTRLSPAGRLPDALILTHDNALIAVHLHGTVVSTPSEGTGRPAVDGPGGAAAFAENRPGEAGFRPISRPKGIGREAILGAEPLAVGGHVAFNHGRVWTSADGRSWQPVRLG